MELLPIWRVISEHFSNGLQTMGRLQTQQCLPMFEIRESYKNFQRAKSANISKVKEGSHGSFCLEVWCLEVFGV